MWSHSPTYSLRETVAAVRERDRYKFERYVDVDRLIQSFLSDYASDNPLAMAMAGALSTNIREQVAKAIEDGTTNGDSRLGNGVNALVSGTADLRLERQGPNAYFRIPIGTKGGVPFELRFHMTQVPDGYWRVDRVTNAKELIAVEAQEDAAHKAAAAKQIEDRLGQLAVIAKLHTSVSPDGWTRTNRFQVRFQNNAPTGLTAMTGQIRCTAAGFEQTISLEVALAPGEVGNGWEFRVNQFIGSTEKMYALGETSRFDVEVDSLSLEDATMVRRADEL
jgi:hypothetical protein